MEPPKHICAALHRKNPLLRLAWWGQPPSEEGELNPGCFALLKLIPIKYVGRYEDPHVMSEFWDATLIMNSGGGFEVVRAERGPVFNRWGSSAKKDWPTTDFAPVIIYLFNEAYGKTHADVFSGRFLEHMRTESVDALKRQEAQEVVKQAKAYKDMCGEMATSMIADAAALDYTNNTALKHIKQEADPLAKKHRDITQSMLNRRRLGKYAT